MRYAKSERSTVEKPRWMVASRIGALVVSAGRKTRTAASAPEMLAAMSHRSVCEYRSSSPVILPSDTSSTSLPAPSATAFGVISIVRSRVSSVPRSVSNWSANAVPPSVVCLTQSRYSSRCQPVNIGSSGPAKSSTRASSFPSSSRTSPATGSIRSQLCRLGAYSCIAWSRLPARTASVNFLVSVRSVLASPSTNCRYDAVAACSNLSELCVPRSVSPRPEPEPDPDPEWLPPALVGAGLPVPFGGSERTPAPSSDPQAASPSTQARAAAQAGPVSRRRTAVPPRVVRTRASLRRPPAVDVAEMQGLGRRLLPCRA